MNRLVNASAVLLSLLLVWPAVGQATRPALQVAINGTDQVTEEQPLRISDSDVKAAAGRTASAGSQVSSTGDLSRIAVALLVVICVILCLRSGVKYLTTMPGQSRGGKMVTVLSRSIVSPRQQVLVLQVGKRLIVVGDSAGRMNPLCEITDPDEIAMLVGQTRQSREMADRNPKSFLNIFRRANEPFSETDALALSENQTPKVFDPDDAVSTEEMSGLMDKVRMLQEQFRAKT